MSMAANGLPTPDGDVDRGPTISAVIWVECGVSCVLLLARLWTRLRILKAPGWDDAFICLALACAVVNSGLMQASVDYGTGRHINYLTDREILLANKYNWISQGFHVMSTNWGKVSVGFFLLRIVDRAKEQRIYFYTFLIVLTVINSGSIGFIYGQCKYREDLWTKPENRRGTCWDPSVHRDVAFFQGSFSAFSDGVLAVYPVFVIWNLKMPQKMKIIISMVMMLGVVAMVAGIVKTIYLKEETERQDYTFETTPLNIWVATEQYLIIIAACIPALGPLVKMAREQSTGRTSGPAVHHYTPGQYSKSKASAARRGYLQTSSGKFTSSRSNPPDTESYPLGPYTTTWTGGRGDDTLLRGDNDSEEVMVSRKSHDNGNTGIMKTFEVQVQSDHTRSGRRDSRELRTSVHVQGPRYETRRHPNLPSSVI